MSTEMQISPSSFRSISRSRLVAGLALILIGALSILAEFVGGPVIGRYFLLLLGAIFLVWAVLVRSGGLLIPGGVLSGIGLGVALVSGPLTDLPGETTAAVFMFSFALGWAVITALSLVVGGEVHLWALIPGGIMALVGAGLLVGGPALEILSLVGRAWPLVLVAIGLYVIFRRS